MYVICVAVHVARTHVMIQLRLKRDKETPKYLLMPYVW